MRRYLFSTNHRIVGLQYFWLALAAALAAIILSVLMRVHLIAPDVRFGVLEWIWPSGAAGGVMTPELYLSLMTVHGTLMVFFVLSTAPQSAFGNALLPLQTGASELAYPWLSAWSFWLTALAFVLLLSTLLIAGGGPLSGWTAYPPLSA